MKNKDITFKYIEEFADYIVNEVENDEEDYYMTCPECGEKALLKTEGCVSCMKCGYSRCG